MKLALNGSSGLIALVDREDYKELSQFKWYLHSQGYAQTNINGKVVYMHRMVMKTPEDMHTDHINHDVLDNRKRNLRIVTRSGNMQNVRRKKRGTVHRMTVKGHTYWIGAVKVNYKRVTTVTCATEEMAQGALKQLIKSLNRED